ncbi:MAG: NAD(P)-dependent alcohol dehydrogenase [Bacteroidales bacterium]
MFFFNGAISCDVDLTEADRPSPGYDEVLVKVYATTVNRTDCGFRSARYFVSRFFSGLFKPRFGILGNEFAGIIEAVGKDVILFNVGDRVFGFNDTKFGAHAEYMTVAETDAITTIPDDLTFEQAAPITEGAHYALCDIRAAKIKSGQDVMIYGASGAIGSAAVQLVKYIGAQVTAICDAQNVEAVKSLGADQVIDYLTQDFSKIDKKFDFIFDAVGKSFFGKCRPLLKNHGTYISAELGKNGENIFLALLTPLFGGKKVLFRLPSIKKEDVVFLKELVESGKFKPLVDKSYPLDRIVDAYRYVETGQKTGNVVITMT